MRSEAKKDIVRVEIWYREGCTCVATYAIEAVVTDFMPWIRALPDRVAFGSFSTELGDVKICLNACQWSTDLATQPDENTIGLTVTSNRLRNSPLHGSSSSYFWSAYSIAGH
jgi:hypothetical protein